MVCVSPPCLICHLPNGTLARMNLIYLSTMCNPSQKKVAHTSLGCTVPGYLHLGEHKSWGTILSDLKVLSFIMILSVCTGIQEADALIAIVLNCLRKIFLKQRASCTSIRMHPAHYRGQVQLMSSILVACQNMTVKSNEECDFLACLNRTQTVRHLFFFVCVTASSQQ